MRNRIGATRNAQTDNRKVREMRTRVRFDRSGRESINRRLDEMDMSLSDYLRHLVQKDIGVYV